MARLVLGLWAVVFGSTGLGVWAGEPVDWEMVSRIRNEAFHHSKVMETAAYLTDVIGPRLTGSPQMKAANEWTRDTMADWGLDNAHLEAWGPFGRGWSFSRVSVHMLEPHQVPLFALPKAWTPATGGPVTGSVILVSIEDEKDLEKYKGKVAGKILLMDSDRAVEPLEDAPFQRYDREQLDELVHFPIGERRGRGFRNRYRRILELRKAVNAFLEEEGALATIEVSSRNAGVIRVGGGGSREPDESVGVPGLVMAAEGYHAIKRHLKNDREVRLELSVEAQFHGDDLMAYNTIAEITGSEKAKSREIVMVGGHLDSWHGGTGATDNASSCAVAMEAVRILKALDVIPRRTIRVALWSGEEQGLLGARAYVNAHFAARPEPEDPEQRKLPERLREPTGPLELKPDHEKLSAYFNLDNGSGKIRGIYCQENGAVKPIFEAWLEPFHDIGADTVTLRNTGGTDHQAFDQVGLPGFQFIQDGLNYFSQTHHTNLDVLDYVPREDLVQASAVLASFLYHAAQRPQRMPRKPMPEDESSESSED